jgi:hypothetical protein
MKDLYDIFNELKDKQISVIDKVVMPKSQYELLKADVREESDLCLTIGFGMKMVSSDMMPDNLAAIYYQDGSMQVVNFETGKMSKKIKQLQSDLPRIEVDAAIYDTGPAWGRFKYSIRND